MKIYYRLLIGVLFLSLFFYCGQGLAEDLPDLDLNPPITEKSLRPDLAETYQELFTIAFMGMGFDELEGLDLTFWVAEMSGDPMQLFENTNWPADTQIDSSEVSLDMSLEMTLSFFGDAYKEIWGEEWLKRAKNRVDELEGVMQTTKSYNITSSSTKSYTIQVMSPYFDPKTLEIHEGTFVSIAEVDFGKMLEGLSELESMFLDEEESTFVEEKTPIMEEVPIDFYLGSWKLDSLDINMSIDIKDYLGREEDENGRIYDFYQGEIVVNSRKITVDEIPEDMWYNNGIRVERVNDSAHLYIYADHSESNSYLTVSLISSSGNIYDEDKIEVDVSITTPKFMYESDYDIPDHLIRD